MTEGRTRDREGILLLDKPPGISSFQALRPAKRAYPGRKIGHAGTLDPAASGLLLLGVGAGTRLLEYLEGLPKTYTFDARFGLVSDTYDMEGTTTPSGDGSAVTEGQVAAALAAFRGVLRQTPPAYSAIKVNGARAYDLARAGEAVTLSPREVTVHSLEMAAFAPGAAGGPAVATLEVRCSKGTYVRSLVHDLGAVLGCGAVADRIRRTAIGPFRVEDAADPADLASGKGLLPLEAAVPQLPAVALLSGFAPGFLGGKTVPPTGYSLPSTGKDPAAPEPDPATAQDYRVLDADGRLLAIATFNAERMLCPKKVLTRA
jgi:tRNA pseudouridine55 synthase